MAIQFRNDPFPFPFPSKLYDQIITHGRGPLEFFIFGHAFSITDDKIKRLGNDVAFRAVNFDKFIDAFLEWKRSYRNKAELILSKRYFDRHRRVDPFSRLGYYDSVGRWLGSQPKGTEDFIEILHGKEANSATAAAKAKAVESTKFKGKTSDQPALDYQRKVASFKQELGDRFPGIENQRPGQANTSRSREEEGRSADDERSQYTSDDYTSGFGTKSDSSRQEENTDADTQAAAMGFSTTTSRRQSNTFSTTSQEEQAQTAFATREQAEQVVKKSEVLNKATAKRYDIGRFDLMSRQRSKRYKEVHVPVSRGNYSSVTHLIVEGRSGGFVLTGPTGCGKSTVALLQFFVGAEEKDYPAVMVVEPTQANAANILHEFVNILPNMVAAGIIDGPVPHCEFIAPTVSKKPFPPLAVTTVEKVLEYFYFNGELPSADYFVLDEFHLPIPQMVELVEMLRTFSFNSKYVLVSATAIGFSVSPELPRACTQIYGNLALGTMPTNMERSDLDPRRWFKTGDGTVAIVAPNVVVAKRLFKQYKGWGLRTFLITRYTVVSDYMKAAVDYRPKTVFVLEPGVEAGVTLSISVLISMGVSTMIRYDGKVVTEATQPLDEVSSIQRGSRGGRVKPTLYVTPQVPKGLRTESAADYYRAQAIVKMVAMGARLEMMEVDSVLNQFPKLGSLNKDLASRAVLSGGDPFLAVYKTSTDGNVYVECGGTGKGFEELAKSELFVYKYKKGFYVAPISDFSDLRSRPDLFVVRTHQLKAAEAIVAAIPGLVAKFDLDDLVGMVIGKFDVYVDDFFSELKLIFDRPEAIDYTVGMSRPAEVADFLAKAPAIVKLFEYLKTEPLGVSYLRVVNTTPTSVLSRHSFAYDGKVLNFAFDARYLNGKSIDVKRLSNDVYASLKGLLSIEILLRGAEERVVDLDTYKDRVPSEHKWFAGNVLS